MPLPRTLNKRASLRSLTPFPFIVLAHRHVRRQAQPAVPAHHTKNGFRNPSPYFEDTHGLGFTLWVIKKLSRMFTPAERVTVPSIPNDGAQFRAGHHHDTVTWIGHATVLVQMDGKAILTDPVWSRRAGPFARIGAPRISAPGVRLEDLPPIDCVLISHNHYDHLDVHAIEHLARNTLTEFFVPLGLESWMRDRGAVHVHELDWWAHTRVHGLNISCTPAQHFSGRGLTDRNATLWAGWSVEGRTRKLFFGGDSGYGPKLFKEIGVQLGPFDLALLPIGAYAPRHLMRPVHMDPAEAVQASLDLQARAVLGMHWGTFSLTDEKADDPPKRLEEAVRARNLPHEMYWTFMLGETRRW